MNRNIQQACLPQITPKPLPGSARRRASQRGFTLVEIMVVVFIIGVLLNIALPGFVRARDVSQQNACIENLRTIQMAKEEWAMANNQSGSQTPTWNQILPYIKVQSGGLIPVCPATGEPYIVNEVDQNELCPSYPGPTGTVVHSLNNAGG